MGETRIDRALARIEAALARMDAARGNAAACAAQAPGDHAEKDPGSNARVMELVNAHERLREEVADTLRDLDTLIDEMEG
jgi:hypothetical protein